MTFENPILTAWADGRAVFGPGLAIPSSVAAELVADTAPDFVMVDMQHGLLGFDAVVELIQAVNGRGLPTVVRVPVGEYGYSLIERVLDAGAHGTIAPVVNNVEEAKRVVRASRYVPVGQRSFGPTRAGMMVGGWDPVELAKTVSLVQIESAEALENVEDIMALEGLDGVWIGPTDLALSLGEPMLSFLDAEDPLSADPIKRIKAACDANGKVVGIACMTGAAAKRYADQGFRFMTVSGDNMAMAAGVKAQLEQARSGKYEQAAGRLY